MIKYLDIQDLNNVPYNAYLKDISIENNKKEIKNIFDLINKKYIINWHGNNNLNEKNRTSRNIPLENFEKIFEKKELIFIIVTQEISVEERKILEKYNNVKNISKIVDKENGFEDTMYLLKHVDGLITTDTVFSHIGGTMDINTYVLLNKYCEWRWGEKSKTAWYPNLTLLRQTEKNNWENVFDELDKLLN